MIARRGFALLAALWIVTIAASAMAPEVLRSTTAAKAALNRAAAEVAAWEAFRCASLAHAFFDETLRESDSPEERLLRWQRVRVPDAWTSDPACSIELASSGARADANEASAEELGRVLRSVVAASTADSIASAIVDWRDADSLDHHGASEHRWYLAHDRPAPRNGPIETREELLSVRGVDAHPEVIALLDTSGEPVDVLNASDAVMSSLPGLDEEMRGTFNRWIARGGLIVDLRDLTVGASVGSRAEFERSYADLARRASTGPRFWVLTAKARHGAPPVERVETWHLGMADGGLTVRARTVR